MTLDLLIAIMLTTAGAAIVICGARLVDARLQSHRRIGIRDRC